MGSNLIRLPKPNIVLSFMLVAILVGFLFWVFFSQVVWLCLGIWVFSRKQNVGIYRGGERFFVFVFFREILLWSVVLEGWKSTTSKNTF